MRSSSRLPTEPRATSPLSEDFRHAARCRRNAENPDLDASLSAARHGKAGALVPRWNGADDPREVRIEDARDREAEFTLDRNGFALVKAPTAVANFYDPEEIERVYYPEVERLVRDTLGAGRVVVFDHNVRNATRPGMAARRRGRCTTTTR